MIKFVIVIYFAIVMNVAFCKGNCSPFEDTAISETNGTWVEYEKTKDFLTSGICVSYNINCTAETECDVDILQKNNSTPETIKLKTSTDGIQWDEELVHIKLNKDMKYAVIWNCGNETIEYRLAVLIENLDVQDNKTITTHIENFITTLNHNFTSQIIKSTECSSVGMLKFSLVLVITIFFTVFL